ncbi:MAG: GHKL domain-containing protein [Oscillospiraceae bacterium]
MIKLKIIQEAQSSTLSIKNTVIKKVEIVDNEICTTKANAINHGYGIKNIKNAIEIYGGTLSLSCDDGWFSLTGVIA